MSTTNFLIGRGELLTHDILGPRRKPGKAEVYTLSEAKQRLVPQFTEAHKILDALPSDACPSDFGVVKLTLNPSYIARSFFPAAMLRSVGLESVGSRTVRLTPGGWTKKGPPKETSTTELFVAGKRQAFRSLAEWTNKIKEGSDEALDLAHIEKYSAFTPQERIANFGSDKERFFEVGIHLLPDGSQQFVQQAFIRFAKEIGVNVHAELSFTAGNLWFVPIEGKRGLIEDLAKFVFVRVIRPVPKMRGLRPVHRSGEVTLNCRLPAEQPLSSEPKVRFWMEDYLSSMLSVHGCAHIEF